MLIEPSEQEAAITLDFLVKIQGPSASMKFLGVQWYGACQESSSMMKDKLLHLVPPTTNKEAQYLVGFFEFWWQHTLHLGILPWPIYHMT